MTLDLPRLAAAIRDLNMAATKVSAILGRPALPSHVGEAIAAAVFDIELTDSATTRGYDGHFRSGPLAGMSVNIKFYPRHQRVLDINPEALPSYFLVLAGPTGPATSSRGQDRPWVIDRVFLFDAPGIVALVRSRGAHVGVATSVPKAAWAAAEVYPVDHPGLITVDSRQRTLLAMFASGAT